VVVLSLGVVWLAASPALASDLPSGEVQLGQSLIEPAYDYTTGNLIYLLTPIKSPFPTHTSSHAVAPLYLVIYPPDSKMGTLNCMGVPGNCPDHDGEVATAAVLIGSDVFGTANLYGTDTSLPALQRIPGHDHLVGIASNGGDFNIAWEVWEVLFTPKAATDSGIRHITTLNQLNSAVTKGDVIKVDLGFAFHCSVVSAAAFNAGTPVG
jgi:hypothetical protein